MYLFSSIFSGPIDTADTTRVLGCSPIDFNIYATKMIYSSSNVEWRPNAIILVPLTTYHYGLLAAPLIHFPINAPLLFTGPNCLLPQTLSEIIRLSPTGKNVPAKIIIIGPISRMVEMQLKNLGLSTFRIMGNGPISTAAEVLEFRHRIPPDPVESLKDIMIVSSESHTESIHAAYFSAHMGTPILFTYIDKLPKSTISKLSKYKDKNVFVIGSERTISAPVIKEIKSIVIGKVDRIEGSTPYEAAVNFAKYHSGDSMFGWNINEKDGWSFCFGLVDNWAENLSACIFAHLAKHTPLLYIKTESVPDATREYVLSLNPGEKHPPQPPFMHGYILGGPNTISHKSQVELEETLILRAADHH